MANPDRVPDPRLTDPLDPVPPAGVDPLNPRPTTADPRYTAANAAPGVVNRVETRSAGSGVMIAAVVLVLAIIAYFVFAPGSETPAPTDPAVTSEPAAPATDTATPPAATAPAPAESTAPAAPADPVAPAPTDTAPAEPAPAAPAAPAPAPAQ